MLEVLPIVLESHFFGRWPRLRTISRHLHKLTPVLAVAGMGLSLLHQSSLGATYAVLSGRAKWFKPSLPILFILSALAGGVSLTLLATIVVAHFRGRRLISENLQAEIARYIGLATAGYLYLKLWDWAATSYYSHAPETADALARLNLTTPYTRTFWGIEVLLGAVIPAAILLNARTRRNERALLAFTLCVRYLPLFPRRSELSEL